jgi:hypothetical protein
LTNRLLIIHALVALIATPTPVALDTERSSRRGDFEGFRLARLWQEPAQPSRRGDFEGFRLASLPQRAADGEAAERATASPAPDDDVASVGSLPPPSGDRGDIAVERICETLAKAAQTAGLPVPFFARLIYQESSFQPDQVSRAGAQGVAQFMPKVAAELGLSDPFDPVAALPVSAQFLRTHLRYFGNLGLAAAAYNAGAKRIEDWLARRSRLPAETRNYVIKITGHQLEKWIAQKPLDLPMSLPADAPCEGVAGLSRTDRPKKIEARLEPPIAKIVEKAKAAAAMTAAHAARKRLLVRDKFAPKFEGRPDAAGKAKVAAAGG